MTNAKQFYLDCLKNGKQRHDRVYNKLKTRFGVSATIIRNELLADGFIREAGFDVRNDGKKLHYYELTGKKFKSIKKEEKIDSCYWDDGSQKSTGNAFNWKSYAKGIYKPSELAAQEAGRKWGVSTAGKQILPRVTI